MTTVTGLTSERMLAIEGASVVDGEVVGNNLILTKHDGNTIDAGNVRGPQGAAGAAGPPGAAGMGGSIPGEIKMWPGGVLPLLATYGKWVWADGGVYATATYPLASGNIAAEWRTFSGASDPGAGNFRVPDMRGVTPVGMDAMPGGARANRMTRAVAIVIAGRAGEETHTITIAEMPIHSHAMNVSGLNPSGDLGVFGANANSDGPVRGTPPIQNAGGGNAIENLQPTVFVPYIVCLQG